MTINDHVNEDLTIIKPGGNTLVTSKEWGTTVLEFNMHPTVIMDGIRFQNWFKKAVGIKN